MAVRLSDEIVRRLAVGVDTSYINQPHQSYELYVKGNTLHNGVIYLANGTTYYINNTGRAVLQSVAASSGYLAYPSGGVYNTTTATVTGALKVLLPQFKTNTMMQFDVNIYMYEGANKMSVTYTVGGYLYGDSGWYANSNRAYSIGIGPNKNLKVRFGTENSKACITIGETNTTWNYPQVSISNITYGYSNANPAKFSDGWSVSFVTTLPSTISGTIENPALTRDGTANRIAWYPTANSISSGTIVTDGEYLASLSYLTINEAHQTSYRFKVNGTANITTSALIKNVTVSENTISSAYTLYLNSAAGTSLIIQKGGTNKFRFTSNGAAIQPEITNSIALGASDNAWGQIYGNGIHANVANKNNAGGLSLYDTTITNYGIATRTGSAHGWICAATTANLAIEAADTGVDLNINFYNSGSLNRGWKFMMGTAIVTSISGRGYISANRLNLNRVGGTKYGRIYWFDTDVKSTPYYTWVTYMSDATNGTAPTGGKPGTLGTVTSWALRSLIENADGYGWTWESAANGLASANTTQPTARMALSSHSGRLFVNSTAGPNTSIIWAYSSSAVSSGGYQFGLNHWDDKLAAGANTCLLTGFNDSTNNQAVFGFHYAGNNSNDNYLELGLRSNNNLVKLYKNNRMAIKASTYPDATRTYTLGTSSLYWKGAYIYAGGTIHESNIYWGGSGGDMTTIYDTTDVNRGITAFRYPSYNFGNKMFGLSAESVTIEYTTNSGSSWAAVTDAWYTDDRKRNLFNYNDAQIPVGNLPKFDYGSSATTQAATVGMGVRVTADFEHENRIFQMSTIETYWRIYCCTCTCTIEMFDDYNDTWTTLWTDSYNNVDTRRYYHFGTDKVCDGARVNRAGRFHKLRWTIVVTAVGTSNLRYVPSIGGLGVYGIGVPTFSSGSVTPSGGTATVFKHGSRFAWAMARWNTPIYVTSFNNGGLGQARIPTAELYIGDDMKYSAANTEKWSTLILGNDQNISGENTHSQGRICIYSAATKAHFIYGASTTTNYSHYLPNANGWIATGGNGSSTGVGAANTPIFLSTAGVLTACSGTLNLNAASATKLATGRTFQIKDNDATNAGPVSSAFNGEANLVINLPSTIKVNTINSVTINNSGNLNFAATGTTGTSGKITWNGSTDGVDIYYYVPSSDQGNLMINTRDDTNCNVVFAYNGTMKIGVSPSSSCIYPVTNNDGALGGTSLEWGQTYTRIIFARHFDSSANFTDDRNMYYGYNSGQNHLFYTMDGTTRTLCADINNYGIYCHSGWFRSLGSTGWQNETYGGGWYMEDSTWIRTYNSKSIYMSGGTFRCDGTIQAGSSGSFKWTNNGAIIVHSLNTDSWNGAYVRVTGSSVSCQLHVGSGGTNRGLYDNTASVWTIYHNGSYVYCGTRLYSAVWNDFAEYREGEITEGGRAVYDDGFGVMRITTERMQPGSRLTSDTFGISVGESDTAKTPIGVGGRVLAYPYQNRNNYHVGDAVCAAPNGTIDIMTREEIMRYPDRIIGIVSEIPQYDVWAPNFTQEQTESAGAQRIVQVNGRIWIYVR